MSKSTSHKPLGKKHSIKYLRSLPSLVGKLLAKLKKQKAELKEALSQQKWAEEMTDEVLYLARYWSDRAAKSEACLEYWKNRAEKAEDRFLGMVYRDKGLLFGGEIYSVS